MPTLIALVRDTHAEHGRPDLMVNNAGITIGGEPDELAAHRSVCVAANPRGTNRPSRRVVSARDAGCASPT